MNAVNTYPKLHNAAWPGVVGKGSPDGEPFLSLDTMLDLTAAAEVDGVKFDGVDLFLYDPHVSIDATDDDLKGLAEKVSARGLVVGSVVAPVWPPTGGGSAMGSYIERRQFIIQVSKACKIARRLHELGVRRYGIVRIDSACTPVEWATNPAGNTALIAAAFRKAGYVAASEGEHLAAEGEVCWGGLHSWQHTIDLLKQVNMLGKVGFQADLAHTYLFALGINAPEHALLKQDCGDEEFWAAYKQMTDALRPWALDFHVAQNDGTVHGSGSHDRTGRHCLPNDPNGKLDIVKCAGYWLEGAKERGIKHICWDGCMFPNEVMQKPQTWNDILRTMIAVRDAHGWQE